MNKAIVYSMDTVFAVYVILIAVSSYTILFQYTGDFGEQDLELSRIARDAYNIRSVYSAVAFPEELIVGSSECTGNEFTGHAFVILPDSGMPKFGDYIVCLNIEEES